MEKIFSEYLWLVIIIVLVWSLPWKAAALWRAARRGHVGWFLTIIILNTLGLLDILYIFVFSKQNEKKVEQPEKTQRQKYWEQYAQQDEFEEDEQQQVEYREEGNQWEEEVRANQQDGTSNTRRRSTIV